jgi:hypothetical protein
LDRQFDLETIMSRDRKLQVFVSSTYLDLIPERQAAVTAILEAGHIPAGMELFAAGSDEQLKVIRRWIDASDIFLLVLGGRYGSLEPGSGLSYTELEYRYAIETGKPFFAILLSDAFLDRKVREGAAIHEVMERDAPEKLKAFRCLVMSRLCRFVEDEKDIRLWVARSIHDLEKRHEFVGWISGRSFHASPATDPWPLYTGRNLDKVLSGKWTGTAQEIDAAGRAPPIRYDVSWDFYVNGGEVGATSSARGPTGVDTYALRGRFLHDRFVRLEYFNENMGEVNFGTEVLQVSDTGRHFVGRFVGYSSTRSTIISGTIEGTKE